MKAVILAGGFGTRLRPLTYTIPKPMLPVINRPILDHTIERLANAKISEAIVTTNYLRKQIEDHLKKNEYPIPVIVIEEKKPLGTACAVRNVRNQISGNFLVVQGDNISSLDLSEHLRLHKNIATISLTKVDNPAGYGIAQVDKKGRITRFFEKPSPEETFSNLANTGTYSFDYEVLDYIPKGKYDFSLDLFPKLMAMKKPLYGIVQAGYWKDVGTVANYFASNQHMLGGILSGKIGDKVYVSRRAKLAPPYLIGEGTQIGADVYVGPNTIIGNNCHIGSNTIIAGAILHDSVKIGSGCKIDDCVLGDKSELSDNVFVGSRAVLGSGCIVERNAKILGNSILGPIVKVQASTEVNGVISPNLQKIEKVSSILNKIPIFKKLERNELQICLALIEFGELRDDFIANVSKIPADQIDKSLTKLQKLRIIRNREGGVTSLIYEDPEKIYDWVKRRLIS